MEIDFDRLVNGAPDQMDPYYVNSAALSWHLVFTKPAGELTAKRNLERQGYRVYFPRVVQQARRRGKWRERISALFPRYVFVQLNAALQSLGPIASTLGVARIVRFGTEYVPVSIAIIDELMGREDATGFHRLNVESEFKPGGAVRVIRGALVGIEGIFERAHADDRVTILLNMLGCESRIQLVAQDIEPASIG